MYTSLILPHINYGILYCDIKHLEFLSYKTKTRNDNTYFELMHIQIQ